MLARIACAQAAVAVDTRHARQCRCRWRRSTAASGNDPRCSGSPVSARSRLVEEQLDLLPQHHPPPARHGAVRPGCRFRCPAESCCCDNRLTRKSSSQVVGVVLEHVVPVGLPPSRRAIALASGRPPRPPATSAPMLVPATQSTGNAQALQHLQHADVGGAACPTAASTRPTLGRWPAMVGLRGVHDVRRGGQHGDSAKHHQQSGGAGNGQGRRAHAPGL